MAEAEAEAGLEGVQIHSKDSHVAVAAHRVLSVHLRHRGLW